MARSAGVLALAITLVFSITCVAPARAAHLTQIANVQDSCCAGMGDTCDSIARLSCCAIDVQDDRFETAQRVLLHPPAVAASSEAVSGERLQLPDTGRLHVFRDPPAPPASPPTYLRIAALLI